MKWSELLDALPVCEILKIKHYQFTTKSKEWGQAWTEVARNVTKDLETDYAVSQKSARDRFNLELDEALDPLLDRVTESNFSHEKATEKKNDEKDRNKGEELRWRSLETFG